MGNLTKFSKVDLAETGFKNRTVAAKYLKNILKKKAQKFNSNDELKATLKKAFNNFLNFDINLNEVHQGELIAAKFSKKFGKIIDEGRQVEKEKNEGRIKK